jgi:hypothetical protein
MTLNIPMRGLCIFQALFIDKYLDKRKPNSCTVVADNVEKVKLTGLAYTNTYSPLNRRSVQMRHTVEKLKCVNANISLCKCIIKLGRGGYLHTAALTRG